MIAAMIAAALVVCTSPTISDGDTLVCDGVRVRLFGINAPELGHDPGDPDEPGGQAAAKRLEQMTRTRVECEPAGDEVDHFGRLIARCRTAEVEDLGAALVRQRLACQSVRSSRHAYDGLGNDCRERAP